MPTENNKWCFFCDELENDKKVYFHFTKKSNFDSIIKNGFLSCEELIKRGLVSRDSLGDKKILSSVSYSDKSSNIFPYIERPLQEDYIIFAVRFDNLPKRVEEATNDIQVYDKDAQPYIIGYCEIPKGFSYRIA